jgi:Protein of unknown function (DUF2793)
MPDDTTILSLPLILPAQAQKHVTHNEALVALDLIVQLAVISRTLTTPPAVPTAGDRYIVAAGAVGAWAGQAGRIALFDETGWQFTQALPGWQAHVLAEGQTAAFDGLVWETLSDQPLRVPRLGVAAAADAVNRLTVAAPATLLTHAGQGHQLKLNKATATDTASLLFQTGFSGRAEMGTAGSDAFGIKVSADGTAWVDALVAAPATGEVTLPAPLRLGGQAADPASPVNGTFWLNTSTGEVRVRSGGLTLPLGGGISDGDKGDITVSGGGSVWAVDPGAITLAKLASVPTDSFLGRDTPGTGVPEAMTATQARGILNVADGATANATDPALRDRATHTGTQPASTIAGLATVATSGSASDLGAGTLPAARLPALTGDVTSTAGTAATLIAADAVTNAKLANMATATIKGRVTAATGDPEDLTGTQVTALLNTFSSSLKGMAPASGGGTANFLRADGTWVAPPGGGGVGDGDKGDIAVSGGGTVWTIDPATVTLAKMADIATARLVGRASAATGVPEALTGTQVTALLDPFSSTLKGLVPASGGGTTTFLRADGTFAVPAGGSGTDLVYTAATRLLESSSGADVTLPLVTATAPGLMPAPEAGPARYYAFHDMMSVTGGADFAFGQSGTGAGSAQSTSLQDGGVGWVSFNLGTTATGRTSFATALVASILLGTGRASYGCRMRQVTLSDATNTYTARFGFVDSVSAESTDGVFFRYTHATNSGKWQAVTRANGVETAVDTGVTAAISTTYRFEIAVNAAGTSAGYLINGASVATITTNIPTAAGRETGAGLMLLRSVGTAAVTPLAVDYVLVEQVLASAR